MKQNYSYDQPRRTVAYVSVLGTTQLHLRNPFIIAFWSMAFPGLGHLLLSKYIRGFLLFVWEVFINYKARINLLILYSFLGDFDAARNVVDIQWLTFYIPTYIFAIWDSYRTAVDMNHNYILAVREDAPIKPFHLSALEINYLDKRKPWIAAFWSLLMPGVGQLYLHRIVTATFIILFWIIVAFNSKILPLLHFTILGHFELARAVVNMQWFLNVPSVYLFSMYDAYVNSVENNKLYEWEQSKFLKSHYQSSAFQIPIGKKYKGDNMYVVSTFEHSKYLELAMTALQMKGVKKENILAVPMDKRAESRTVFDSIHGADGISLLDIPLMLAVLFGIFGSIYGSQWYWGPLLWGLISMGVGAFLGFIIKFFTTRKYEGKQNDQKRTEVVLMIGCLEDQVEMVKDILWAHYALGVRKLDLDNN